MNPRSGAQRGADVRELLAGVLRESGRSFRISVAKASEIKELAEERAATKCDVLVAGGGDGTVCAVGEAALRHGTTLGVIPLGTFNYFAKNIGIPLEVEQAARVLVEGKLLPAPVLDLDGRLILNSASIGIHPAALLKRRKLYRVWGRSQLNAYLSVLWTAFQPPPRLRVRLRTDTGEVVRETPMVTICSNAFQMQTFGLVGTECLASGKFALYIARMAGRATTFRLGLRVLFRRLRLGHDYEAICASEAIIETLRRHRVRVALDGELGSHESPMRFRLAPKELMVLAPRERAF